MNAIRVNKNMANQVQFRTQLVRSDSDLVGFFIGDSAMKRIPLTKGMFALVDDEDFKEVSKHKWYASKTTYGPFRAIRGMTKTGKNIYMHRQIMNVPANLLVDHRNHNTLDNQKTNLRVCTRSQNGMNAKKCKNPTASKYKGVYWDKGTGKWRTAICKAGKIFRLGRFSSEVVAAKAYDRKAVELFGEFAYLNFAKKTAWV